MAVVETLAAAAGVAIENARLFESSRRRQHWLEAATEINEAIIGGVGIGAALALITLRARELLNADATVLLTGSASDPAALEITAGSGAVIDRMVGRSIPVGDPTVAEVFSTGNPKVVTDLAGLIRCEPLFAGPAGGPAMVVPLRTVAGVRGVLIAMRRKGRQPYSTDLPAVLGSIADQAVVASEFAEKQRSQRLLDLLADRDRIATDLHDHVIQRLFATGLSLQGTLRRVTDDDVRKRLQRSVEQLDQTVREIRTAIFDLHTAGHDGGGSLRRALLDIVAELTAESGLTPSVRIGGAVDTLVPAALAEHAEAVLREAVSNAVRHADASSLSVAVDVTDRMLIDVTDNGRGLPPHAHRSGLANLDRRARQCGGEFAVTSTAGGGTTLSWRVPLVPPAQPVPFSQPGQPA